MSKNDAFMRHAFSGGNRKNRPADWLSIAPAVCERLLGEPSGRSAHDLRWGPTRSFRLKLDTGTWSDFRTGEGGGLLSLVMREERLDKAGALAWLERQGFLTRSPDSRKAVAAGSPYSRVMKGSATRTLDRRGMSAWAPSADHEQSGRMVRREGARRQPGRYLASRRVGSFCFPH